jgi:hypothetical protein
MKRDFKTLSWKYAFQYDAVVNEQVGYLNYQDIIVTSVLVCCDWLMVSFFRIFLGILDSQHNKHQTK